jgi:hypothetical protein
MDSSTWSGYRFASGTVGRDPFFTEPTNPDYYPALWEAAGFVPFQEYVSNIAAISGADRDDQYLARHGIMVRPIDTANLTGELSVVYPLCMEAFAGSPLFTTITPEEFTLKMAALHPLLDGHGFTRIAYDASGRPVAFILCFRDILNPGSKTLVLKTVARDPLCRVKGLIASMLQTLSNDALAAGYTHFIHALMHTGNKSLVRSAGYGGQEFRRYTLYKYDLQ